MVLWLAQKNATMETNQDAINAQSFQDINVLGQLARNQLAQPHVVMG